MAFRRFSWVVLLCLLSVWTGQGLAQTRAPSPPAEAERPPFVEKPVTPELLQQLRAGGLVLYMRHGYTDNSHADRMPHVDLNDCNTQRVLSDKGRALMREVGKAIRDARIPIGEVLASPMCRTRESARLAAGEKFRVVDALMYSSTMNSEEKKPRLAELKLLLGTPVAAGSNRLLVAHAPNLDDLIGFFVRPEGTVVVFRPSGATDFEYLASIHPEDWRKLPGRKSGR